MSFGVKWITNAGAVAISTDSYGLIFIGNATKTATQKPDAFCQMGGGGDGGWVAGTASPFYVYTIVSVDTPLVFLQLLVNQYFSVCSVTRTTGNNWEIIVGGNNWSTVPILKCFSNLQGVGGAGVGLKVFDAAGKRTWDSNENMLVMKRRDAWAAASNGSATAITQSVSSSIANPYILTLSEPYLSSTYSDGTTSGVFYTMKTYIQGWYRDASNNIYRVSAAIPCGDYRDSTFGINNNLNADRSYLIDGSQY